MDYRLKPLGTTCAATGEPLLPGEKVMSVAIATNEGPDGGFERKDYSRTGWEQVGEEVSQNCLAQWQAVVPPPIRKKPGLDPDEQMARFEQLTEEDAPHQAALVYVLALWLVRKRRLKMEGSFEEDGVERLKVVGMRGEGTFEIRDQTLGLADIDALQAALFEQDDEGEDNAQSVDESRVSEVANSEQSDFEEAAA